MADSELISAANKLTGVISKLTSGVSSLNSGISAVAKGNVTGQSLVDAGTAAAGLVPGFGAVGQALGSFAKTGMQMADDLKAGSQYGAYFNQNLGEFAETVLGARDSMESWNARLAKSADAFSHLGSNMDKSMVLYGKMAKDMQDMPLAAQLEMTGIKAEELNDVMATNISMRKFVDFNDANAKKEAINSTLNLVKEMDDLARTTGLSRDQQKKQLEEEMKRPDVAALMMSMTKEQQTALLQTSAKMGAQAENVRNLFIEMAAGNGTVRSTGGGQTMAALNQINPEIAAMMRESSQLLKSGSAEDRKRAEDLMSQVGPMIEEGLKNPKLTAQIAMMQATGEQTFKELGKIVTDTKGLGAETAKSAEAFSAGFASVEEYEAKQKEKVEAERKGLTVTGEQDTGAAAYRTAQALDRLGKDISAGATPAFTKLNNETGELIKSYNLLNGVLRAHTAEEARQFGSYESIKGLLTGKGVPTGAGEPATAPTTTTGEPQGKVTNIGRAGGSLGAVGKWLEDWGAGTPVTLHGKEGIVTEEQFKMIGKDVNSMLSQLGVNGIGGAVNTPTSSKSEINVEFSKTIADFNDKFKSLGVNVTDLTNEMLTGGLRTQKSVEQFSKLGLSVDEFQTIITKDKLDRITLMQASKDPVFERLEDLVSDVTPESQVTAEKDLESKKGSDTFSDMIFGIGDIAGKAFDDITKGPDSITGIFTGIGDIAGKAFDTLTKEKPVPEGFKKEESGRTVLDMKTPEEWNKIEKDNAAIAAFDKKYNIKRDDIDVVGLKNSQESAAKINEEQKNKLSETITTAQSSMISAVTQAKEAEKLNAAQQETPTEAPVKTEKPAETAPVATETPAENEIKTQLVMLNKQMGQLVNYTMEVATNSKQQIRATKQAASNNIMG